MFLLELVAHILHVRLYTPPNVKLMLVAIKLDQLTGGTMKHYRHCLAAMQCNPPTTGCYFGKCNQCPGVGSLSSSLQAVMDENAIDTVELRQWTTTDRASLETRILQVDEFIDTFNSIHKKLLHDFIAKMQTMFMHEKRESLTEGEFFCYR